MPAFIPAPLARLLPVLLIAAAIAPAPAIRAQITHSNTLNVVPVPGSRAVAIDGDLDEWDLSGAITLCYETSTLLDTHSARVAMMHTADALYVAVIWRDPTPMLNNYDPSQDVDRRFMFHSDCIQLMFNDAASRRNLFAWHYAKTGESAAIITTGRQWFRDKPIRYIDAAKTLNVTQAFTQSTDGRGYTQEIRIPWAAINPDAPAPGPGDEIPCMIDLSWGPPSGKGWPESHVIDLVQPGAVHNGYFWETRDVSGKLLIRDTGNLANTPTGVRPKQRDLQHGAIPIRVTIPADAARFTIAINDTATGRRIRNLAGDLRPEEYTVTTTTNTRTIEVLWDGLDDRGNLVTPGSYTIIGLTHHGLDAIAEMTYYNPGTPPWPTPDGRGSWMSDHYGPRHIAAAPAGWIALACDGAEGGSGIIGIGPDGKKQWGEKTGATAIAADTGYIYIMLANEWANKHGLARLKLSDGSYAPYTHDGKPAFPLPLTAIFGDNNPPPAAPDSIAVLDNTLALAFPGGSLALLDATTAALRREHHIPGLTRVVAGNDKRWYALIDGKITTLDIATGAHTPVPGIHECAPQTPFAVDASGNIHAPDTSPDSQIKIYSPAGKLIATAGKHGGRSIRGPYDPLALRASSVSGLVIDTANQLWIVEHQNYPRRVSVWKIELQNKTAALVRDYLGNTGYSGVSAYLHDSEPTRAYLGAMEFDINPDRTTATLREILWEPDPAAPGETFAIDPLSNTMPHIFTSDASGRTVEYLYAHDERSGGGNVIYMRRDGRWQPVAAICAVGHISGRIDNKYVTRAEPTGDFAGLNTRDVCFWSDTNSDGKVQRSECTIIPTKKPARLNSPHAKGDYAVPLENGWGGRIGRDLVIYTDGITRFAPAGFTADGAPIYTPGGMSRLPIAEHGDLVPIPEENLLLCASKKDYPRPTTGIIGIDTRTGALLWSYPNNYPHVHGSHRAPLSRPGLIIGPLKICGVADMGGDIGRVFMMRGNLGEDYLMTTDGLYVGALFKDSRLPAAALPATMEDLRGKSLAAHTNGGEPFNGWFGRQSDGRVRLVNGFPRQGALIAEVLGLDTIRRFTAPQPLMIDSGMLARCESDNAARAAAVAEAKTHTIRRKTSADTATLANHTPIRIDREGHPVSAIARLAYDDTHLHAFFDVADSSPWKNKGKDNTRLFKTGDSVDIQLSLKSRPAAPRSAQPLEGDARIVIAPGPAGKPVAVLMRPIDPSAPKALSQNYHSPVWEKHFDRVEVLDDAQITVATQPASYTVAVAIPLKTLNLAPRPGQRIVGDLGVIASDTEGTINVARIYWSNKTTNLVSDLPTEAWLTPDRWGELAFE